MRCGSRASYWMRGIPVGVFILLAWSHRWVADDAFVNLRIVRQLEHGNGFVFNIGDRVEAGTSPLWIAILTIADGVTPFRLEWIAVVLGIAMTAGGLWLSMAGTQNWLNDSGLMRPEARRFEPGRVGDLTLAVPLGAVLYIALPPAWDFGTSGLENGLGILWLGGCWLLLTRLISPRNGAQHRPGRAAYLLIGIGPFIRPDFIIFSAAFAIAAVLLGARSRRATLRAVSWMLAIPVIGTLMRTAYFGIPVPNTAITKEASQSSWKQGWWYLQDFFGPSWLLLPLLAVLLVFGPPLLRQRESDRARYLIPAACAAAGGLAHGLFVVRAGGDFMHARLLLPSLFVLVLPVAVVVVSDWRWVVAAAVIAWAVVAGVHARPQYSGPPPNGKQALAVYAIDPKTHIADERLVHRRLARRSHPVTLNDYAQSLWGRGGLELREYSIAGGGGLVVDWNSNASWKVLPTVEGTGPSADLIVYIGALGMYSYAAPLDARVLDRFGLSNSLAAHLELLGRGRPGHEKQLPLAWVIAEYADPAAPLPKDVLPLDVVTARRALRCGSLRNLIEAQRNPLGPGQVWRNLTRAWQLWRFRMPWQPGPAANELCE